MTDPRDDGFGCNANDAFGTAAADWVCASDSSGALVPSHSSTEQTWGTASDWSSDSFSSSDWSSSDW